MELFNDEKKTSHLENFIPILSVMSQNCLQSILEDWKLSHSHHIISRYELENGKENLGTTF